MYARENTSMHKYWQETIGRAGEGGWGGALGMSTGWG